MRTIKLKYSDKEAIVDDWYYPRLMKYVWYVRGNRGLVYAYTYRRGRITKMHNMIIKKKKGFQIDHINRNSLDNRKENLRYCTHSENQLNKNLSKNNTSGHKGVNWDKSHEKWVAILYKDGKTIKLGRFTNKEDAILARKEAFKKAFNGFTVED